MEVRKSPGWIMAMGNKRVSILNFIFTTKWFICFKLITGWKPPVQLSTRKIIKMNSPGTGGPVKYPFFWVNCPLPTGWTRRSLSLGTGVILDLFYTGVDSNSRWYPVTVLSTQGSEVMSHHCEHLPPRDPMGWDPKGDEISCLDCPRAYTGCCLLRRRVCPPVAPTKGLQVFAAVVLFLLGHVSWVWLLLVVLLMSFAVIAVWTPLPFWGPTGVARLLGLVSISGPYSGMGWLLQVIAFFHKCLSEQKVWEGLISVAKSGVLIPEAWSHCLPSVQG